jgi:hypothetical protein
MHIIKKCFNMSLKSLKRILVIGRQPESIELIINKLTIIITEHFCGPLMLNNLIKFLTY